MLQSPPSRRRGLKYLHTTKQTHGTRVASFSEAWIEIFYAVRPDVGRGRRLLLGGVD